MKKIRFIDRRGIYTNVSKSMYETVMENLPKDSYLYENSIYDRNKNLWVYSNKNTFDIGFFSDIDKQHGMFICHGIADKRYRDVKSMHLFDNVVVSGLLWKDKLISQGLKESKIKVLGYPKLDYIFNF